MTEAPTEQPGPAFSLLLQETWAMLDAVRALSDTIEPHAASLETRTRQLKIPIPPGRVEQFGHALSELGATPAPDAPGTLMMQLPDGKQETAAKLGDALVEVFDGYPIAGRQVGIELESLRASLIRHTAIINGALLTMSVGSMETLVAGLARRHYELHPAALGSQEKEFSLADLLSFSNLDAAREAAIGRRVDKLMRDGLDEWIRWFDDLLGGKVATLPMDLASLRECVQRRHIVVHNGSRVSQLYIDKTASEQSLGALLPITRAYLESALDEIEVFGTRLGTLAWIRWGDPPSGEIAQLLNHRVIQLLGSERWAVAEALASTGSRLTGSDQHRLYLRINAWQATKRRASVEAIRTEVSEWDTSALSVKFRVAQAALLDEVDRLVELVPQAIEQGQLARTDLDTWPLFREARADARWEQLLRTLPYDDDPANGT